MISADDKDLYTLLQSSTISRLREQVPFLLQTHEGISNRVNPYTEKPSLILAAELSDQAKSFELIKAMVMSGADLRAKDAAA